MNKKAVLGIACSMLLFFGCDSGARNVVPVAIQVDNALTVNDEFVATQQYWRQFEGQWIFTDGVIRQTSSTDYFPLILREDQQYGDLDMSVEFKPLSGHIDASGGLVFRAQDRDNYYIVRANALENNFRLYIFSDGNRHQIASARVSAPTIKEFHTIRVVVESDHIQAYLDGELYLDHYDSTYESGFVGLWTKADSVTDFDNLHVVGSTVK